MVYKKKLWLQITLKAFDFNPREIGTSRILFLEKLHNQPNAFQHIFLFKYGLLYIQSFSIKIKCVSYVVGVFMHEIKVDKQKQQQQWHRVVVPASRRVESCASRKSVLR